MNLEASARDALARFEDKLDVLRRFLLTENEKYNLTALTEAEDVSAKHFFDSFAAAPLLPCGASVCDVGCGAGFPLLPLALARGDCTFLGVDATEKKVNFVRAASSLLALENCRAEHLRAEELCSSRRESFDVVTARAVAELSVLCEYCLPLLKEGGLMIAYKGPGAKTELDGAKTALSLLGGSAENVIGYSLPTGEERALVLIRKTGQTPLKYPRGGNKPRLKPLK